MRSIAGCKPIHPNVRRSVKAHARRIFFSRRVPHASQADIEQELYAAFYERQNKYDSSRSSFRTFVERIVRNCAETLAENAQAEKRGRNYDTLHFSDIPVETEDGECLDAEDTIGWYRQRNGLIPEVEEQAMLVVDTRRAVFALPPHLRDTCLSILAGRVSDAAVTTGVSRWTVHHRIAAIKKRFVAAGLDAYVGRTPQISIVSGK